MKRNHTKQLNLQSDSKLSDQQMTVIKGGDDGADILTNSGSIGGLTFGGGA